MKKSALQLVTSSVVCWAVLVVGLLAAEPAKPLKVGEAAEKHLGTGIDDKPLLLSKYRGKYVCFACVDHHK